MYRVHFTFVLQDQILREDSPDHPIDVDVQYFVTFKTSQFLSYIRKDFLEMINIDYLKIVMGQPCFTQSVHRSRN